MAQAAPGLFDTDLIGVEGRLSTTRNAGGGRRACLYAAGVLPIERPLALPVGWAGRAGREIPFLA